MAVDERYWRRFIPLFKSSSCGVLLTFINAIIRTRCFKYPCWLLKELVDAALGELNRERLTLVECRCAHFH